jgi:aspartate dehydrogenase
MLHGNPINIGIVGAGAIGSFLIRALKNDPAFKLIAVADVDTATCLKVLTENGYPKSLHIPLENFPENTDVFIEAASGKVAPVVAKFALEHGKIAIVASIGGLDDIDIYRKIATKTGGRLILPSGAISGLDALKAIPKESISEVTLRTTKPARTLADAKYFTEKGINPSNLTESVCIFSGVAREAAKEFPKSINVAAALSHATIGLDKTKVEIWADPSGDRNIHEIRVVSGHGTLETKTSNVPFEENPKTSRLAAYSILATVRNLTGPLIVGT